MPAEPEEPVVLEPTDGGATTVESPQGSDAPRKGGWLIASIAGALLVAAVAVNFQLGDDSPSDDSGAAETAGDESADGSLPDDPAASDATTSDSATPAPPEPDISGDERAGSGDETGSEPSQAFGEPEYPVSGVEPHIPSRVRSDEPGPPAQFCVGSFSATRFQLPLRFASTKPEGVDSLSWAPDCRRMVFRVGSTLWAADADGTSDLPFLTAQHGLSAPSWSPSGRWIAFSQGAIVDGERASHIYIVQSDALGLAQVTDGVVLDQDPAWSPDGTRIAFSRRVRAPDGNNEGQFDQYIVVVEVNTGSEQMLTAGGEHESAPSWSPDGELITYRRGDTLTSLRLEDLVESTLMIGGLNRGASWSKDGSRVATWRDWEDGWATIAVKDAVKDQRGFADGGRFSISIEGFAEAVTTDAPQLHWGADNSRLFFYGSYAPGSHWAYVVDVPQPGRSREFWATADTVEETLSEAGYVNLGSDHSIGDELAFAARSQTGERIVEISIAFDRSEPQGSFAPVNNPHSELDGISRGEGRIGVWFVCGQLYGEILTESQSEAATLASKLMSAACADS